MEIIFFTELSELATMESVELSPENHFSNEPIEELVVPQDLHSLPLLSLWQLLIGNTEPQLRQQMVDGGALPFILKLLKNFVSKEEQQDKQSVFEEIPLIDNATKTTSSLMVNNSGDKTSSGDKVKENYWAKGTGFGTGSTTSTWNIDTEKKKEEKQIVVILSVLSAFLVEEERKENMSEVSAMLEDSCVVNLLAGYLRNDSVLDMSRHISLYNSVLTLVRALSLYALSYARVESTNSSKSLTHVLTLITID